MNIVWPSRWQQILHWWSHWPRLLWFTEQLKITCPAIFKAVILLVFPLLKGYFCPKVSILVAFSTGPYRAPRWKTVALYSWESKTELLAISEDVAKVNSVCSRSVIWNHGTTASVDTEEHIKPLLMQQKAPGVTHSCTLECDFNHPGATLITHHTCSYQLKHNLFC